ncbi:uncharacterized protein PRCAT00005454001 [Priceomyces carsonii]|uniref:uncharacterized protein n=1 Tax=Priceomyces carsonii TaxID=28549 RepID=UPI002ED79293|nr:unnamed protein product [Priceomyces carsonii]
MPLFGEAPYTSITVKIDQLSTPGRNNEIDETIELYLSDLLELIRTQSHRGSVEAARAIRKRIKYGTMVEEQLRALKILELLILNSGNKIGPDIASDTKLLQLLRSILNGSSVSGSGSNYNHEVVNRVKSLAIGWKFELEGLDGYSELGNLWKSIPGAKAMKKNSHSRARSSNSNVFESPLDTQPKKATPQLLPKVGTPPSRVGSSSANFEKESNDDYRKQKKKKKRRGTKKGPSRYADDQFQIPQINYKVEAAKIKTLIADCHTHTTILDNILLTLPKDQSPLDNKKAAQEFNICRKIRRKVLRYLQYVGVGDPSSKSKEVRTMDEEFLGSLITANEQLVNVFKHFDTKCGYNEENLAPNYDEMSDSDESYYTESSTDNEEELTSERLQNVVLSPKTPPPRPAKPATLVNPSIQKLSKNKSNDTISSDPFGDGNEVAAEQSVYD